MGPAWPGPVSWSSGADGHGGSGQDRQDRAGGLQGGNWAQDRYAERRSGLSADDHGALRGCRLRRWCGHGQVGGGRNGGAGQDEGDPDPTERHLHRRPRVRKRPVDGTSGTRPAQASVMSGDRVPPSKPQQSGEEVGALDEQTESLTITAYGPIADGCLPLAEMARLCGEFQATIERIALSFHGTWRVGAARHRCSTPATPAGWSRRPSPARADGGRRRRTPGIADGARSGSSTTPTGGWTSPSPTPCVPIGIWIGRAGVLAPGENIPGLAPGGRCQTLTGTSAAVPFATATAALLWSLRPRLPAVTLRHAVLRPDARRHASSRPCSTPEPASCTCAAAQR